MLTIRADIVPMKTISGTIAKTRTISGVIQRSGGSQPVPPVPVNNGYVFTELPVTIIQTEEGSS